MSGHALCTPFLLETVASHGESGLPSNTWFLGFTRLSIANDISIGSAVLQGSLLRQTDRPRYSVCNNRPHLRT